MPTIGSRVFQMIGPISGSVTSLARLIGRYLWLAAYEFISIAATWRPSLRIGFVNGRWRFQLTPIQVFFILINMIAAGHL